MWVKSLRDYYIFFGLIQASKLLVQYFATNLFSLVIICCLAFLAIIDINLLHGNVSFLFSPEFTKFLALLGVGPLDGQSVGMPFLINILGRISFPLLIIWLILKWLFKIFISQTYSIKHFFLVLGGALISELFLISLISVFAPRVPSGSLSIIPVLIGIWLTALGFYIVGYVLNLAADKIGSFAEKISILPDSSTS